jgi:hypothetical protein
MPSPFGQLQDAQLENRRLRKKLREAKLMIESLSDELKRTTDSQMCSQTTTEEK